MNNTLALVRAAHLHDYIAVMRDIGAPVDRYLAHSRLPPHIEETPNLYVSVTIAMEWIARCGRDIEPMALGFLAAQQASITSLRPSHQAMIVAAQTGLRRLEILLCIARLEDSGFRAGGQLEEGRVRIFCDIAHLERHPFICFAEWLNLQAVISVVRSVAGPDWCPSEMSFVSRQPVPPTVQAAFPNTRILIGQPRTSILVGNEYLGYSTGGAAALPAEPSRMLHSEELDDLTGEWTFTSLLRATIRPYLNGGDPDLALAAEIAGMSKRSLQRRLRQNGSSYSQILKEARFELARSLLEDRSIKIIDVAITSGYESPQHFSRAFRLYTGTTPTAYRNTIA